MLTNDEMLHKGWVRERKRYFVNSTGHVIQYVYLQRCWTISHRGKVLFNMNTLDEAVAWYDQAIA